MPIYGGEEKGGGADPTGHVGELDMVERLNYI